ncbi:MAG: phosphoribosyl-ATP diphosphatase [Gammaproteobacteria bacterium]|jgi:phosphoribosyl-ATP pyrophosphohydrolase|nr:phosphoribosyl-ATP diphosphatase [Gammaproteobacteria bacterium]NIN62490.1 phosphoribosyl-ATP diphosphatase [Gammaproteobacteria bacterium]NIO62873.1 phosphoribosyl-ATP diphosphatase [Gammaproteobacteria bacterium]NIP49965.1 phosphoribosyl-ATP diphosphatase [Gammaproteobacteria bacterium]NIQ12184.1 phosphoribosyl-ATP diphosphatase [Gammaproteobacteria bacterium]
MDILNQLSDTLEQRKTADPETSYVASLYAKGPGAVLKKIGEEATELVLAANSGVKEDIIHETADLWFHTLVMLSQHDLGHQEVLGELQRRFGQSGIEEKARRKR